ncbi:MAG: nucleotide sugar dehydrogenase [Gammaproteobacteria bacterium]
MTKKNSKKNISIIGLGYVGLPLAVEFSKKFNVVGFDHDKNRIEELINSEDLTNEVTKKELKKTDVKFTSSKGDLLKTDVYIVTVPTPVDSHKNPNLKSLMDASKLVGSQLKKNNLIIYESTVFPGATEELCIPILEKASGLKLNKDFYCGYSPERVNPGNKDHKLTDILKITSGSNKQALKMVDDLYKEIINAGTYKAESIKVAEAAKVIENTQRDLNIALVNELSLIFNKMNLDTNSVINAASTKWNFMKFTPGLVGGHCIGVDPYYLTYKAKKLGYSPEIILAGRNLNDKMPKIVTKKILKLMKAKKINIAKSSILVLGATFKENCPDIRNSKVIELIDNLSKKVKSINCFDPLVSKKDRSSIKVSWLNTIAESKKYDAIIFAVPHKEIIDKKKYILNLKKNTCVIYDLKGFLSINETDGRL